MINKIYIDKSNSVFKDYWINGDSNSQIISGLNRINIFVGANNSGKSRLLRELFKSLMGREVSKSNDLNQMDIPAKNHEEVLKLLDPIFISYSKPEPPDFNVLGAEERINEFKKRLFPNKFEHVISYNEYLNALKDDEFRKGGPVSIIKDHNSLYENIISNERLFLREITFSTYIPVLRSIKKSITTDNSLLKERIFADYFKEFDFEQANIFTGEDFYDIVKKLSNSLKSKKAIIKEFENFLEKQYFFSEFEIASPTTINDIYGKETENKNRDLYVQVGKENQYPISEIGDGIQALILLTFPLFLHRNKNHVLFIEEPEINLHPGMQRLFLETLNDPKFKNTQIFITTHSNHFLDLAIETQKESSIFSFEKRELSNSDKFYFDFQEITKRAVDALTLLGVNTSSVFLSNCTIWIEGISERLYLRKYLELFQAANPSLKIFKEDIHFSFVEYAGNNITHWSFLPHQDLVNPNISYEAISKNIFLISDKDISDSDPNSSKSEKNKRNEYLKNKLGENYVQLNGLEIENLLSPNVLYKTIENYKKNVLEIKFKKDINEDDYRDKPIGNFITEEILIDEKQVKKFVGNPSGTGVRKISNKREFTLYAISHIKEWGDLSKEAQELTIKVYNFIERHNKSRII